MVAIGPAVEFVDVGAQRTRKMQVRMLRSTTCSRTLDPPSPTMSW
jgi:hypothetical protein